MEELQRSVDPTVMAIQKIDSVTQNMNSAIDKFVETGKFSFADFSRSIIQDIIKIELKAQATKLFSSLISTGGSFLSGLLGFANGGNPPVNKPSIVGENGPELFVPKTAGTVIPNGAMGGSQQTVNNNTVYNISAIDARSVAEFFAANRKTMWGSIQMAQKELPYGNR
jgi:phage-related minor tail protein